MSLNIEESWFQQLDADHQSHIRLSFELLEREKEFNSSLHDYSFVVFPAAKAYEGFLKLYLFNLGLIDEQVYKGTRFRIGRALNADIRGSQKDDFWLYDEVEQICGQDVARLLWQAWLECRNRVFHYFPEREHSITFSQAEERLLQLVDAIRAGVECQITMK